MWLYSSGQSQSFLFFLWGSWGEKKISIFTASHFLDHPNLLDTFLSVARMHSSTESTLLCCISSLVCLDSENHSVLILLSLTQLTIRITWTASHIRSTFRARYCSDLPLNYKTDQFQLGLITFRLLLNPHWCTAGFHFPPYFILTLRFWTAQHSLSLITPATCIHTCTPSWSWVTPVVLVCLDDIKWLKVLKLTGPFYLLMF